ncbi:PREDICTED: gastrokine-1 [Condylura cristata]|uniref:gastrokine-1 n=1 Tax=Condylura cristata TaxID=143302 RepID=UPI0003344192|nr:PREDICTED: gastrokine-1 [Condylura cristata]
MSPCLSSPLHCFGEAKMKFTIVFAGLLGISLVPAFSGYSINVNDNSNSDDSGRQSVSINNAHNVANVDNNNGWDSWNSIWDYNSNFAAIRLFRKKMCVVHRMNKEVMPSLQALGALAKQKRPEGPPPKGLMYTVNSDRVDDLDRFGKPISVMCKGIPTYVAEENEGASLFVFSEKCANFDVLWILNISLCGGRMED